MKREVVAHSLSKEKIYKKLLEFKDGNFSIDYLGEVPEDWVVAFLLS